MAMFNNRSFLPGAVRSLLMMSLALLAGPAILQGAAAAQVVEPVNAQETTASAAAVQDPEPAQPKGYVFTADCLIPATAVKDQGRTGTCWSFATASFFESEVQRKGGPAVDLSEMFIVRNMYARKARNYLLRQGKTNFGEGALAHDYVNMAGEFGLIPEEAFPGRLPDESGHDHGELEAALRGMLDALVARNRLSTHWPAAVDGVLNAYLGRPPATFEWEGRTWTPQEFRQHLGIRPEEYIHLTSWSHHPFGQSFVLEIPDNISQGSFYNVPLDALVSAMDQALDRGYSVAWDGDVSEPGFLANEGFAVLPSADGSQGWRNAPAEEPVVDQAVRQAGFESLATTDDHLMHVVGRVRDQHGRPYYVAKNSWGPGGRHAGQVYLSEGYVRMKTIAITIHGDAVRSRPEPGSN